MATYLLTYGEVCTYDMEFDGNRSEGILADNDTEAFMKAEAVLLQKRGKYIATFSPRLMLDGRLVAGPPPQHTHDAWFILSMKHYSSAC